jgi:predicted ATPase with chaperone activity
MFGTTCSTRLPNPLDAGRDGQKNLSARGYQQVLKLASTIADLAGANKSKTRI